VKRITNDQKEHEEAIGLSDDALSIEEPRVKGANGFSPQTKVSGLTHQILAYMPALLIPGLVNFLALALYTRLLSAEAYGRYAFVLALVVSVKMVGFEWLRLGLFRFFQGAQRDGRLPMLLSTTMVGFLIISLLVSLVWVAVLSLIRIDEELRSVLWLGLPLLLIWGLFEQILQISRAAIAPARYGLLSASRAVLCLGASLCFIRVLGQGESGLMLGLILGTAVPTLADLARWVGQMTPRLVERALATDLLRYSMPFVAIFSLDFIPSVSNRFLLQHFLGSEAVGLFAAGYDLANQTVTMLFIILNLAAYPLVVRALEQAGKDAAREQLRQYSIILFALALPTSVGLAFIAQLLSTVVLGEAFRQVAGQLMPWVALSTFVMGAKAFYSDLAFQLGLRTKLQIWAVAAAAMLNVFLNLWWIPIYGVMGAVWATCAAYTLALVTSLELGRKVFPLPFPISEFGRIALATLLMAIVLLLVPRASDGWIGLGIMVGLGAAAYMAAIWFVNVGQVRRHVALALRQLVSTCSAEAR
jgi:O-antigen/teichoic acid export membrane protein